MATAEEIRAQIAARQQRIAQTDVELDRAARELSDAEDRQRLRRQLDILDAKIEFKDASLRWRRRELAQVDRDVSGPSLPVSDVKLLKDQTTDRGNIHHGVLDCDTAVLNGEVEWSIKGFSWLQDTLAQVGDSCVWSPCVTIAGHCFQLCYSPAKDHMGDHEQLASLAIWHEENPAYNGVVFRYSIWIQSKERGYVQWGESGSVCIIDAADCMLFGPDVCLEPMTPAGIFGMDHSKLLGSEWVINDILTAKLSV
jgi:hypothetical protein